MKSLALACPPNVLAVFAGLLTAIGGRLTNADLVNIRQSGKSTVGRSARPAERNAKAG